MEPPAALKELGEEPFEQKTLKEGPYLQSERRVVPSGNSEALHHSSLWDPHSADRQNLRSRLAGSQAL